MSVEQRCGTCLHWCRTGFPDAVFRSCLKIEDESHRGEDDRAYAEDRVGDDTWIMTRADFGCVLHEPRKEAS